MKKYVYFISYQWLERYGDRQGLGRCEVVVEEEIRTFEDILSIEEEISGDMVEKVIISYQILRIEEN